MIGYIILGIVVGAVVVVAVGYGAFLYFVKKVADKSPFGG